MNRIVVGITGASGSIYAKRLIEVLLEKGYEVIVICTDNGQNVMSYELNLDFKAWTESLEKKYNLLCTEDNSNLFAGVASGSYRYDAVIILPCSMGTLAEISCGYSKNLLTRVCDVALKEKRRLVIVPRETPLSAIHLENMLKLSRLGVTILPAMPGFYHKPQSIEDVINFIVGKILDNLSIENNLYNKWKS